MKPYASSTDDELNVAMLSANGYARMKELADLTDASSIDGFYIKESYNATSKNRKAAFTLVGIAVKFKAGDSKNVAARLVNNN